MEAVTRHGNQLLALFPNATTSDPVKLCKQLRRVETAIAPIILRNCNEGVPEVELDAATSLAELLVSRILGIESEEALNATGLHVNRDPRGYALKFSTEWAMDKAIYKDWGGYGIVAPDLTEAS